jgi:hypothetical protein
MHRVAYGELMAQYKDDQNKIVSWMEFSGGMQNFIPSNYLIVFGNMSGVLFAAFLAYFLGFVGPFAFCGTHFSFDFPRIDFSVLRCILESVSQVYR